MVFKNRPTCLAALAAMLLVVVLIQPVRSETVELPTIKFKGEPAARRKDQWLRVNRCHFRGCRVPLSFLMVTNDCLFTDCKFEDDRGAEPEYKSPFTVTFYTQGCTDSIRKKPDVVTLKNLSYTKLQTPVGKL